jgi:hypothetical protein
MWIAGTGELSIDHEAWTYILDAAESKLSQETINEQEICAPYPV